MLHRPFKPCSVVCIVFGAIAWVVPAWGQVAETPGAKQTSSTTSSPEPTFLHNIRQVTRGMVKAGEGYFSPDGHTIIYQAEPPGYPFYQIYMQPLAGGEPKRV